MCDENKGKAFWKRWISNADNKFLLAMLITMILAGIVGCTLKLGFGVSSLRVAKFVGFPGQAWMALLKAMILPLITATIMMAVLHQREASATGKLTVLVLSYYLGTTIVAAIVGTTLMLAVQPGKYGASDKKDIESFSATLPFLDSIFDLLRNLFPDNIIDATIAHKRSAYEDSQNTTSENAIVVVRSDGTNIVGLMVLSTFVALLIKQVPSAARLTQLIEAVNEVIIRAMYYLKLMTPVGLFFLIIQRIIEMKDLSGGLLSLSIYLGTFLASLFLHGFVLLLILFFVVTQINPLRFFQKALPSIITAFGTSSSTATMSVTRSCVVDQLKVLESVADFMIPVGTTLNMDGGAIHLSGAAIFIAQLNGIDLDFGRILTIICASFAFAVGGAGVPSAGLISLQMVLQAVSLPLHDVPLLVAVEWLTDRCLTTVNVIGDMYGCCIIEKLYSKIWKKDDALSLKDVHVQVDSSCETVDTKL